MQLETGTVRGSNLYQRSNALQNCASQKLSYAKKPGVSYSRKKPLVSTTGFTAALLNFF